MITTNFRKGAALTADPYSKLVWLNIVSSHWGNFRCWRPWPTGVTKAISPHHRGIVESTHHCLARCDHNTPGKFQKLVKTWRLEWYRWLKPQMDTNGIFQKLNHSHPRGVPFLEGYVNSEPPQKVVWTPSTISVVRIQGLQSGWFTQKSHVAQPQPAGCSFQCNHFTNIPYCSYCNIWYLSNRLT